MDTETIKLGLSFVLSTAALYPVSCEFVEWVERKARKALRCAPLEGL